MLSGDRGPNMSALVFFNLLNELAKEIRCEPCKHFTSFSQRV